MSGGSETTVSEVAHGTTVATNAVLEKRGAKTALITTKGFRDVLELRRIRAPQMYDLFFEKPQTLVERYLRFEITERISASGEVLIPLSEPELWHLKEELEKEAVESIAVCTLHAYAFPQHENAIGDFLRSHLPDIPVSLSSEVLPERKEYERTATTVVNAYVRPVMEHYLNAMRSGLQTMGIEAPLLMMQSAGGLTPEADAARLPVFVLESGPAAGVLAAGFTAQRLGIDNLITLDMGGTTAKASIIEDGAVAYSPEYEVWRFRFGRKSIGRRRRRTHSALPALTSLKSDPAAAASHIWMVREAYALVPVVQVRCRDLLVINAAVSNRPSPMPM